MCHKAFCSLAPPASVAGFRLPDPLAGFKGWVPGREGKKGNGREEGRDREGKAHPIFANTSPPQVRLNIH